MKLCTVYTNICFLTFVVFSSSAVAQSLDLFKAGVHYKVLEKPFEVEDKSKIEVAEFFWYGCGHCYSFELLVNQWKQKKAEDVDFVQIPVIWMKMMELHARMYYTNKQFGILGQTHNAIFSVMNNSKNRLVNKQAIWNYMERHKVDLAKYEKVFNSFAITSKVNRGKERAKIVGIEGTPELVVNGKYRITTRLAGSQQRMLQIANYLIEQERKSQ